MYISGIRLYSTPFVNYSNILYISQGEFTTYLDSLNKSSYITTDFRMVKYNEKDVDIIINFNEHTVFLDAYNYIAINWTSELTTTTKYYFIGGYENINSIETNGLSSILFHLVIDVWHSNLGSLHGLESKQSIIQSHIKTIENYTDTIEAVNNLPTVPYKGSYNVSVKNIPQVLWAKVYILNAYTGTNISIDTTYGDVANKIENNTVEVYFPILYIDENFKTYPVVYKVADRYYAFMNRNINFSYEGDLNLKLQALTVLCGAVNDAIPKIEYTYVVPFTYSTKLSTAIIKDVYMTTTNGQPEYEKCDIRGLNYIIDINNSDDVKMLYLSTTYFGAGHGYGSNYNMWGLFKCTYNTEKKEIKVIEIDNTSRYISDKNKNTVEFDYNTLNGIINSYPFRYQEIKIGNSSIRIDKAYTKIFIYVYCGINESLFWCDVHGRYKYNGIENYDIIATNVKLDSTIEISKSVSQIAEYFSQYGASKLILNGINTLVTMSTGISINDYEKPNSSSRDIQIRTPEHDNIPTGVATEKGLAVSKGRFIIPAINYMSYIAEVHSLKNVISYDSENDNASLYNINNIKIIEYDYKHPEVVANIMNMIKRYGITVNKFDNIFSTESKTNFKFIKTVNCNIIPLKNNIKNISNYSLDTINEIFDNGTTLWFKTDNFYPPVYDINNDY